MRNNDKRQAMDFIQRGSPRGFDFWVTESTGNYADDCKRGREAARELHYAMHDEDSWPESISLGAIVQSMMQKGIFDGIETGFFQEIAEIMLKVRPIDDSQEAEGEVDILTTVTVPVEHPHYRLLEFMTRHNREARQRASSTPISQAK